MQVDGAITSAYQQYMANSEALGAAVASSRAAHAASLEQLAAARADYLKRCAGKMGLAVVSAWLRLLGLYHQHEWPLIASRPRDAPRAGWRPVCRGSRSRACRAPPRRAPCLNHCLSLPRLHCSPGSKAAALRRRVVALSPRPPLPSPSPLLRSQAAADGLLAKVEEARRVPEAALSQVSAAWGAFTTMPAVERLLAATRGQVEAAFVRYTSAHDVLVVRPGARGRQRAAAAAGGPAVGLLLSC